MNTIARFVIIFSLCVGLLKACDADAKTMKIVVMDSGFDLGSIWKNHKDFVPKKICGAANTLDNSSDVHDELGHGTAVVGIISKYLNTHNVDYCIYVIKIGGTANDPHFDGVAMLKAYDLIKKIHPDVVNLSLWSRVPLNYECQKLKELLNDGIYVVSAAGNDGKSLNEIVVYPAMCDQRIYKVANIKRDGSFVETSNTYIEPFANAVSEVGEDIPTLAPSNNVRLFGGTSASTAIFTAKLVERLSRRFCELTGSGHSCH